MEAGEIETPLHHVDPRQELFEWLSLREVASDATPQSDRFFSLLQNLFLQDGCKIVARGRPHELSGIECLIIEWRNHAARERFLASELSSKLEEAIAPRFVKRDLIWPINCGNIVTANPSRPPQNLYEILTVYFPAELDDTTVSHLEKCHGMPLWDVEPYWGSPEKPPEPMQGFLAQHHAWMDGKIDYNGQAARRLVYFFKFKDEEAEQHYKENMRWGWRIRDGRKIWEVMDHFLEDLEKLGMLGYESLHVRFLEVVDYISENAYFPPPPSLPLVIESDMTVEEAMASYRLPTECDDDL